MTVMASLKFPGGGGSSSSSSSASNTTTTTTTDGVNLVVVVAVSTLAAVTIVPTVFRYFFFPKPPKAKQAKPSWPVVPGALPLIGNPLQNGGIPRVHDQLVEWIVEYGNIPSNPTGLLEANLFGQPHILVCNNKLALEICKLRPYQMKRPREEIESVTSVGANGVFSAEGEVWRKDRRIMAPPLNHKHMTDYLPFIRTTTQRLIEKWRQQQQAAVQQAEDAADAADAAAGIIINQDLLAYAIDNIGLVAFDQDFDCLRRPDDCQEAKALRTMFDLMTPRALCPVWYWRIPFIGQYLDGGEFAFRRIQKLMRDTIRSFEADKNNNKEKNEETKKQPGTITTNNRGRTYLEKLLSQKEVMAHSRLMGNLTTMFAAGADTTGNTAMICLWELLQDYNSSLLVELEKEVMALSSTLETTASVDELKQGLPQLRAFFYEIARLKGTAPALFLEAAQDLELGGGTIPIRKGLTFYLNFAYLGGLEGSGIPNGPNGEPPSTFCSQRWLVPRGEDDGTTKWNVIKPGPKTGVTLSTGFGNGVRICPGQDLAELEVVFCLAHILKNFEVSLMPNHPPVKLVTSFTQRPDSDIRVVLKPRNVSS